ncbi:MAG: DUF4421 family protein [Bacteroidales bacterium]|nr:DUF4421 family protein [Bacteroidales bacterium]
MIRKSILLSIVFLCSLSLAAQEGNFLQRADSLLNARYHRIKYDTNYIGRPTHKWTLKLRPKVSLFAVRTETLGNDGEEGSMKIDLRSDPKAKLSLSAGYSGVTLSFSIKPEKLQKTKELDYEMRFDVYSRQFGFETELSRITTLEGPFHLDFTGTDTTVNFDLDLPEGFVTQTNIFLSGYYVFNHRRFSYPAAFTQSFIQKRSAGSFIAGANLGISELTVGDSTKNAELFNVANAYISLGLGYGYNIVLPHNWLLHVSAIPYLIVRNKAKCKFAGNEEQWQTKFPQFLFIARAAAIRSWDRWFAGLTTHFFYSYVGSTDLIQIRNRQWHFMAVVGYRL